MRDYYRLKQAIEKMDIGCRKLSQNESKAIIRMLLKTTCEYVKTHKSAMRESDFETNQRKLKKRETELDPKPPISPVRVSEPYKPKKPKYKGNHGPK